MTARAFLPLLLILATAPAFAKSDPPPRSPVDGDRILFFGDSITQAGAYVRYVHAYLLTRFPDRDIRVVNHGISSETISGTSEADHDPRRPDATLRIRRDVIDWKPTILVACFGMNDGNYHPFDLDRFRAYQAGVQTLRNAARDCGASLVLLTPPPFDPYRRQASDPQAREYGYKFPAIDYDDTLTRYSQFLTTLSGPDLLVSDVHTALDRHLRLRRAGDVSFHLSPDAVHPNPTGHWLMAQTLLDSWRVPPVSADLLVDFSSKMATGSGLSDPSFTDHGLSFSWLSPLPLPLDPDWDPRSLELDHTTDRFSLYCLRVLNLPSGQYLLSAEAGTGPVSLGPFTHDQLSTGVDLNRLPSLPTVARSLELLQTLRSEHDTAYQSWRTSLSAGPSPTPSWPDRARLRELARPLPLRITLEAASN